MMAGTASSTSASRMSSMSMMPPNQPAVNPISTPIQSDTAAQVRPKSTVLRTAQIKPAKISWPQSLTPKGCTAQGEESGVNSIAEGSCGHIAEPKIEAVAKKKKRMPPVSSQGSRSIFFLALISTRMMSRSLWIEKRIAKSWN